jgi:hypothetical protein
MTWLPMRDLFTGHDPDTFPYLIEAERLREQSNETLGTDPA